MLTPRLPDDKPMVIADAKALQVVASDDAELQLSIELPIEDLTEIEDLSKAKFSLKSFVATRSVEERALSEPAFESLNQKAARFEDSPKFLIKLAELAALTGRFDLEEQIVRDISQLDSRPFFLNRLGDTLIRRGKLEEAEDLFKSSVPDTASLLRLAAFLVRRDDVVGAEALVQKAISIDRFDFSSRLFEGALHLLSGKFHDAIRAFRLAINERPTSAAARCNMAIAYLGLRDPIKALVELKKATALDPLSSNAVGLLADVSFELKRSEDSITALRYFVTYEQEMASMWSRLARAAFVVGKPDEALVALKRQASLEDGPGVWNNMGIAYTAIKRQDRAISCFSHALRLGEEQPGTAYYLAAKNLARALVSNESYAKVVEFTRTILEKDVEGQIQKDGRLADLVVLHVHSLYKLRQPVRAEEVALRYLDEVGISDTLAVWLVSAVSSMRALRDDEVDVDQILGIYQERADRLKSIDPEQFERFYNNLAFALAERNDLAQAEAVLSKIAHRIHVQPYPTATYGLIQIKKGRVDRASEMYEKAISLAHGRSDKIRLRQKFNLELGNYWLKTNERKARRFLEKVKQTSDGEPDLAIKATSLLKLLSKE